MPPTAASERHGMLTPSKFWEYLPQEIRNMILFNVLDHRIYKYASRASIAPYAVVCREWQAYFERITFNHITVENQSIGYLERIIRGEKNRYRFSCIRHIWLRLKISKYTCASCREAEDGLTIHRNNKIFTTMLRRLLLVLATQGPHHEAGITLEISIHSPSDTQHLFDDPKLDDDYPVLIDGDSIHCMTFRKTLQLHYRRVISAVRRHIYGPEIHRLAPTDRKPPVNAARRFLGTPLDFQRSVSLPRVPVVKGFLMKRQFYRQPSPAALAKLFWESLCDVESFRLERWCRPTPEEEVFYLKGFKDHVMPALPRTLSRFSYYSSIFPRYHELYTPAQLDNHDPPSAMEILGEHSCRFTELHFTQPTSADPFRQLRSPPIQQNPLADPMRWSFLEVVALRTSLLSENGPESGASRLLINAASAARNMPKLRIMEIWNYEKSTDLDLRASDSCVFRYSLVSYDPVIAWHHSRKTSPPSLTDQVFRAWERVASAQTHRILHGKIICPGPILPEDTQFYKEMLETQVAHPITVELFSEEVPICF